ncbi:nadp-dependent d-sorbitol-6-phosphate dehydrogenase [Quercus suber]|uniref:Nadp-dependent d-sorbitol-6-phosphate dehydrogenase n=1 Tax=Quercus suber TaxID=58331 RepID=A0AAW0MDH3_QUESU
MLLAADYKNETEVVGAFQSGLVKREDLFITTKIMTNSFINSHKLSFGIHFYGYVFEAYKDSLKKLQLDYLDLYLVHFPVATKHIGKSCLLVSLFYHCYLYFLLFTVKLGVQFQLVGCIT